MPAGICYNLWKYKTWQHLLIQLWLLQEPFLLVPNSWKNPRRILGHVLSFSWYLGKRKLGRIRWSLKAMTWDEKSVSRSCSSQLFLVKTALFQTDKQEIPSLNRQPPWSSRLTVHTDLCRLCHQRLLWRWKWGRVFEHRISHIRIPECSWSSCRIRVIPESGFSLAWL